MKSAIFTMAMCAFSGTFVWAISGIGLPNPGQAIATVIAAGVQMICAYCYFD